MRKRCWRIESTVPAHSCNQWMRRWTEQHGPFVALDEFYDAITFMESSPGRE